MLFVAALCACPSKTLDPTTEPIGERFLSSVGAPESGTVEMYRAGAQIELRQDGERVAIGTLTSEGLEAWEHAVATVDPAEVTSLQTCAASDGADICVDVEHESGPLQVCYCAFEPPAEVEEFHAYFYNLFNLLSQCESSSQLMIDECEAT